MSPDRHSASARQDLARDMSRDVPAAVLTSARALSSRRWRVAAGLTLAMVAVYFGFILLVAFRPASLATALGDGLSLGIVLGALVIVAAWLLTLVYVRWANTQYDPALAALRAELASARRESNSGEEFGS
jgi:uncharacterized membrane protein (DUF485 family)